MLSVQQARDRRAALLVHDWCLKGYDAGRLVDELEAYASDPRHRDFTPHVVTALRQASLLPVMAAAAARRRPTN